MKLAPLLILTLIVSTAVSAQVQPRIYYPSSSAIRAAGDWAVNQTQRQSYNRIGNGGPPDKKCLTELKTQKVVCRTRAEWVIVASQLRDRK